MMNEKTQIIKKFQIAENDTGSSFVQIAIFTDRITSLTRHLQTFKKDFACRVGLLKIIGKRKRLMNYLKKGDEQRYRDLIKELNIRG